MNPVRERGGRALLLGLIVSGALASSAVRADTSRWTDLTPPWSTAMVRAIALAPGNSSIGYAGTDGGVFKTTDGGASWVGKGAMTDVLALAVDPVNPAVVWAGTGTLGRDDPGSGLWKSTDGASTWTLIHVGGLDFPVFSIAIDPDFPNTVYAGRSFDLSRTKDGGATWAALTNGLPPFTNIFALEIAPSSHSTIYAGSAYLQPGAGFYRSTDRGETWMQLSEEGNPDVRALVVDPTNADVVYRSQYSVGVLKTTDGGFHWTTVLGGQSPVQGIVAFAIDPSAPRTVYAGGYGLMKTTDGGDSWAQSENGLVNPYVASLAIDVRVPSHLYAGTRNDLEFGYSGIYQSRDAAVSWQAGPALFGTPAVTVLAIDANLPTTLFAFGSESFRTAAAGAPWQLMPVSANAVAIDPWNPTTIYVGSVRSVADPYNGLRKSIDGGRTWSPTLLRVDGVVTAVAIDPSQTSTLYAASNGSGSVGGVYKSLDGGADWFQSALSGAPVLSLALDPGTPSILFAGAAPNVSGVGPGSGLFETKDNGESWFRVHGGWPETDAGGPVQVPLVTIDPRGNGVIYTVVASSDPTAHIETGEGLYRSSDHGVTWTRVQDGLGSDLVQSLAIDPRNGALFVGTSTGAFRSDDEGTAWIGIGDGLTDGAVTALTVDALSSTLYAVSNGRLFKTQLAAQDVCVTDPSTLCLQTSRFRVRASWGASDGSAGGARALPNTSDTGALWFFSANNIEVVVKVVDGRPVNGHFWVMGGQLTDVEYTLTVTDTTTGAVWTHHNPQGTLASFADTSAF